MFFPPAFTDTPQIALPDRRLTSLDYFNIKVIFSLFTKRSRLLDHSGIKMNPVFGCPVFGRFLYICTTLRMFFPLAFTDTLQIALPDRRLVSCSIFVRSVDLFGNWICPKLFPGKNGNGPQDLSTTASDHSLKPTQSKYTQPLMYNPFLPAQKPHARNKLLIET